MTKRLLSSCVNKFVQLFTYLTICWLVEGAEEGFEVHGAGFTYRSLQWTVTKRLLSSCVNLFMCLFAYLNVLWCVAGTEERFEVHGAGCQRICSCSGGGLRQGTHPRHPAAEGAFPLPVGNVQGPFRGTFLMGITSFEKCNQAFDLTKKHKKLIFVGGTPFALQLLRAHSQMLCGVSLANTAKVVLFVMYHQLICQSA